MESEVELEADDEKNEAKRALDSFINALPSVKSQREYKYKLKEFLHFHDLPGKTLDEQVKTFIEKSRNDGTLWIQNSIISFVNHYKQRVVKDRNLAAGTLQGYLSAIKLFCDMNDDIIPTVTTINWKKINKGLPPAKTKANDRAPTLKEIKKLVEFTDRRIKPLVYTMCASGIRIGAWDYLKWKHIIPVEENGNGIAKIIVYADEHDEHYSFITPEAYGALKDWMDFRMEYGEKVTGESWVMRDMWETLNVNYSAKRSLAKYPKQWKSHSIARTLSRALLVQGIHEPLQNGARRHEVKTAHSFRKFFKSRAEQVMHPLNVEMSMGHSAGISDNYWRPTEKEVLEDYRKAIPLLSIDNSQELQNIREARSDLEKKIESLRRTVQEDEEKLFDAKKILEDARKNEAYIKDLFREVQDLRDALIEENKNTKKKK